MRQRARIDKNHKSIVECFRKLGCSVLSLHMVGKGCPDLLICYQMQLYLVEVKDTGGKLNTLQEDWHRKWGSPVYVVRSNSEVVSLLNKLRRSQ